MTAPKLDKNDLISMDRNNYLIIEHFEETDMYHITWYEHSEGEFYSSIDPSIELISMVINDGAKLHWGY